MKKVFSIVLSLLLIASAARVSVSLYHCSGSRGAFHLSVDMPPVYCGIQHFGQIEPTAVHFVAHCCTGISARILTDTHYFPSVCKWGKAVHAWARTLLGPSVQSLCIYTPLLPYSDDGSPPFPFKFIRLSAGFLCVYRI